MKPSTFISYCEAAFRTSCVIVRRWLDTIEFHTPTAPTTSTPPPTKRSFYGWPERPGVEACALKPG